ncbi:MAG: hypothetical protein JOY85_13595 [Acidobacteriaceae bacterium]|nr:hypothetical protein [Acidobacteriaceae bacterium]
MTEAVALATEKLPEIASDPRKLREELGDAYSATRINIELRRTLTQLIEQLDQDRSPKETTGGLHKSISEDGRVLWLCSQHYEARRTRVNLE